MPEIGLLSRLDSIRPQSCCSDLPTACYHPAYVGPHYGDKAKILFVGLDSGTSDGIAKPLTAKEWQSSVFLDGYRKQEGKKRNEAWNAHYRGCVRTASAILKMACESECGTACGLKPSSECALAYFAQTNAVKCATPKIGMAFVAEHRIAACMAMNLFGEIELLQPDVIVLQGRNRDSGHIHKDFERELAAGHWGTLAIEEESPVGTITWSRGPMAGGKTILALFSHPSAKGKSNFKNTWVREIFPSIPNIHALLEGTRDGLAELDRMKGRQT